MKDLYQRPIVYIQDGKVHDVETREAIEVSFSLDAYPAEPKNVYVLCSEEQLLLHLSPFFFNINNQLTESKLKKIKVKSLFYAELFASYIQRYTKEMGGYFDSNASFANRDDFDVDASTLQDVTHICEKQSEQNIFLVEAYPGSHYKSLGQEIYKKPPSGFDAYVFWDINLGDITQSSIALINKITTVMKKICKKFDRPGISNRDCYLRCKHYAKMKEIFICQ